MLREILISARTFLKSEGIPVFQLNKIMEILAGLVDAKLKNGLQFKTEYHWNYRNNYLKYTHETTPGTTLSDGNIAVPSTTFM